MKSGESDIIVKTVKEACVEGLVVTGGGKGGIFIKEVKPDSPASKHLSVKEGILKIANTAPEPLFNLCPKVQILFVSHQVIKY